MIKRVSQAYISESAAAMLIGIAPQTLARWRKKRLPDGPKYELRGPGGKTAKYPLEPLIQWSEENDLRNLQILTDCQLHR